MSLADTTVQIGQFDASEFDDAYVRLCHPGVEHRPPLSISIGDLKTEFTSAIDAASFLEAGAQHMRNRAEQRDAPGGERSMAKTVAAFNAIYGAELTEEQGWFFMVLLKQVRASQGQFVADDYEDGAAYFALAGEAAAKNR